MELDKLQLSSFTIHNLYRDSLVKTSTKLKSPESSEDIQKATAPVFLGGNQKNILLVIKNQNNAFLEDHQLAFLTKILTACKLTLADIAVINFTRLSLPELHEIRVLLKPEKVLMFGITSLDFDLPFHIPDFQIQHYDHIHYLTLPPLSEIENNQDLKKAAWGCFQKLFLAK